MNRPPSLTQPSALYPRQLEQNLAYLAPVVSEAALLPVIVNVQCEESLRHKVKNIDRVVKKARNSSFTVFFSKSFTLRIGQIEESKCG